MNSNEDAQGPGYFPGLPFKEEWVTKGPGSLLSGEAVS